MLVQEISIVEKNEINELIEKKNALNNLAKVLNESNDKELYKRCKDELAKINKLYTEWWEKVINEYPLENNKNDELYVDAINGIIFK